jgi:hypothetical protein
MMGRGKVYMDHDGATHEASEQSEVDLAEGYRRMAADREQEMEAEEWTEALVGDVLEVP